MRPLLLSLCLLPLPLHAEVIEAAAPVKAVTLFPWGASVTRHVEFTAAPGRHELIIPGLPAGTDASSLRVQGAAGVSVGAVSLAEGRLPATADQTAPEVKAAEEEVRRLEGVLREKRSAIAAIRAKGEAAGAKAEFLKGLAMGKAAEGLAGGAADLQALAGLVESEVLAARQAGLAAELEAVAAEEALRPDDEALAKAQAALVALTEEAEAGATLTLSVEVGAEGKAALDVTSFDGNSGWQPVYDLYLTRGAEPALKVARAAVVTQQSGEDWRGVDLTLSTARPGGQSAPGELWPWLRSVISEEELARRSATPVDAAALGGEIWAKEAAAPVTMGDTGEALTLDMQGITFTYHFPSPVDLRTGVDSLRLAMGDLTLKPELVAEAVPSRDQTAFLVADLTNDSGELLLPGTSTLYVDGALVGSAELPLMAAGDEGKLGFGPIDGIRLTRTVPDRSEGDQGLISKSTRLDEVAILKVENLTGEDWDLRVIDQVPYSEQEDLEITVTATPEPTETDPDGKRGLMVWDMPIAAGATQEITLEHSLEWPEGMVLQ